MAKKAFYQTEEFKKLNAKWAKRARVGRIRGHREGRDRTASFALRSLRLHKSQYDGGNSYYELCQIILRDFDFRKDIHRTIFAQHAEGRSEREIVAYLQENSSIKILAEGHQLYLINRVKEAYLKGTK
jgi:hypothetical protein